MDLILAAAMVAVPALAAAALWFDRQLSEAHIKVAALSTANAMLSGQVGELTEQARLADARAERERIRADKAVDALSMQSGGIIISESHPEPKPLDPIHAQAMDVFYKEEEGEEPDDED
jgi:hypothetical protein